MEGHPASALTDENSRTNFVASVRREGQWVELDLESVDDVRAVQLNFCDHDLPLSLIHI